MTEANGVQKMQGELRVSSLPTSPGSITTPIPGAITQHIGSGEHAKNSIVYSTILWSFIGGGLLSAAAVFIALCDGKTSPLGEVKEVWAIFTPLITLALGYLFGKGR